jgi:hypothetical protein
METFRCSRLLAGRNLFCTFKVQMLQRLLLKKVRVQHRHQNLQCLRRRRQSDRLHPGSGSDRQDPHPSTGKGRLGSKGPAAPKPSTACRSGRLTPQDSQCHQIAATYRDTAGYRMAPGLKMDGQSGKHAGQRTPIGQALLVNRTKSAVNGSSIDTDFREKGFYST